MPADERPNRTRPINVNYLSLSRVRYRRARARAGVAQPHAQEPLRVADATGARPRHCAASQPTILPGAMAAARSTSHPRLSSQETPSAVAPRRTTSAEGSAQRSAAGHVQRRAAAQRADGDGAAGPVPAGARERQLRSCSWRAASRARCASGSSAGAVLWPNCVRRRVPSRACAAAASPRARSGRPPRLPRLLARRSERRPRRPTRAARAARTSAARTRPCRRPP